MRRAAATGSGPDSADKRMYSSPLAVIPAIVPLISFAAATRAVSDVPARKTTVRRPGAGLPADAPRQAAARIESTGVATGAGSVPFGAGRCAEVSFVAARVVSVPCRGSESFV
jgi:hypothetical protein